ncbi:MAG: hypothetical protein ACJ8F7_14115 [Gemmataceae bacterium]
MRRMIAIVAALILVHAAAGCRHVAGGCDCDHAPAAGAPTYQYVTPPAPAVVAPPPVNAAPMPLPPR